MIAEQVVQPWNRAVQNVLAFREEAAETCLRTDRSGARQAVDSEARIHLAFDEAVYELPSVARARIPRASVSAGFRRVPATRSGEIRQ